MKPPLQTRDTGNGGNGDTEIRNPRVPASLFPRVLSAALALAIQCCHPAAAPGATPIQNLTVSGTSQQASGTYTVQSGATFTAASGSAVNLGACTLTLPLVSLTTGVTGTLQTAQFPATLPALSGVNLTALNASNLASGTLPNGIFPATLPALSGVNLTALNASNLASGTVAIALGGTGIGTAPTAGQILIGQTGGAYLPATLTAGSGITITNASGAITISTAASSTLAGDSDVAITSPSNAQVLTYNSSTSKWANATPASGFADPTTTKGDLIVHGPSSTTRLAVGANTFVLTADSTATNGLAWAAASGSGGYTATVPTASTSTGSVGQFAADATRLYVCTATNTWSIVNFSPVTWSTHTLTYASDGDANGIFYAIGAQIGGGTWTNPQAANGITITISAGGFVASPIYLTARAAVNYYIGSGANNGWTVDLGPGRSLIPNMLDFRQRTGGIVASTAGLTVEGSNDNLSFTTVLTVASGGEPSASDAWQAFPISGVTTAYRYFRFTQTTVTNLFTCGQIEMYGAAIY